MDYSDLAKSFLFQVCALCGSLENLQVHHINGNHYDNRLDNLSYVCVGCHSRLHGKIIFNSPGRETSTSWRRGHSNSNRISNR